MIHSSATPHRRPLAARLTGVFAVWMLLLTMLAPASAGASASEEASFIAQVNSTRASVGLPAHKPDVQLTSLARSWATSMKNGACGAGEFICHASPISAGVTHSWAKLGENVGTGPEVNSVMNAFIASPGHYANIIDPEFTHIGVGVVWDGNRMFTTHRFMKLQGAAPTTTTTTAPTTTTTAAPATTSPPATTAAPATTSAPTTNAPVATTAAPSTGTPQNDGGSPDQGTDPATNPGANSGPPEALAAVRQPQAVLEERASVLITALVNVAR